MRFIPPGPKDFYCPLWRKPMSKVCHTCPWWTEVAGKNKNSGEDVSRWECAIATMPLLMFDVGKATNENVKATQDFRNQVIARASQQQQQQQPPQQRIGHQSMAAPRRLEAAPSS